MNILRQAIKGFVAFAIVGAVLAFAAPALASMVGLSAEALGLGAISSQPLWTGVYFGGFGALVPLVTPITDWLFGDSKKAATTTTTTRQVSHSHTVEQNRGRGHAADLADEHAQETTQFRDKVGSSRADDLSFQQKVDASRSNAGALTV